MRLFAPANISDQRWIYALSSAENAQNADYSFVNIFSWVKSYKTEIARINECCVVESIMGGEVTYSFPIGVQSDEHLETVIESLRGQTNGAPLRMQSISPESRGRLEALYPGGFAFTGRPDLYDYVYTSERLASLAGKKLHAKRNYINNFTAGHEWSFKPVAVEDLPECSALYGLWSESLSDGECDVNGESDAFQKTIDHFGELNVEGGLIIADGEPCAFTLGERLSGETYVIHFEKALPGIAGAYQIINREFVRYIQSIYPCVKYINREEDMGLESLRKSKKSYHPDFFVEKYTATWVK